MTEFAGSKALLVADVDCTKAGRDLCKRHDVSHYPTIMYGTSDELKLYEGSKLPEDLRHVAHDMVPDEHLVKELLDLPIEDLDKKEEHLKNELVDITKLRKQHY